MRKVFLLIGSLCLPLFAGTWMSSGIFYNSAVFDGDSLKHYAYYNDSADIHRIFFSVSSGELIHENGTKTTGSWVFIQNHWNDKDSVWISKYWMENSFADSAVVLNGSVDLSDFRLLHFDSSTAKFYLSNLMDERTEETVPGGNPWEKVRSIYFVYKKDTSYYAYCRIGSESNGCSFFLSCVFQNDGTTNFGKIPSLNEINFSDFENCLLEILPKKRNKKSDAQTPSPLYRLNGCPARGFASEAAAQKGSIKILLKK